MKKSTKILSLLMAVVMIFSLTTVALAVTPDKVTLKGEKTLTARGVTSVIKAAIPDYYKNGLTISADEIQKDVDETGYYQRLPRRIIGSAEFAPQDYLIPGMSSVDVSDPEVLGSLSFSLAKYEGNDSNGKYKGYPCLQFNFTALKEGQTNVTLNFYYIYRVDYAGISDYNYYKDTITFTVTVGAGGEVVVDPGTAPEKPTESDLQKFQGSVNKPHIDNRKAAVYMWCDDFEHSYFFDYVTNVPDGYTLSEVVPNDGSKTNFPVSVYPWMCVMTLDADKYMAAYNASEETSQHYLVNPGSTETVKWFWNASSGWDYAYSGPVYFDITHTDPNSVETKYTVTYTDGVDGAAFADQVYTVKEGDATPAFDGTPEREGYVFLGWEPAVAETVTANATYVAKWEEKLENVTVTASRSEGELLFLNDVLKVTAKANTNAYVTISPTLNGRSDRLTLRETAIL